MVEDSMWEGRRLAISVAMDLLNAPQKVGTRGSLAASITRVVVFAAPASAWMMRESWERARARIAACSSVGVY
jgi:hypothetical protein